jgi:hypothetical protein
MRRWPDAAAVIMAVAGVSVIASVAMYVADTLGGQL